MTRRALRMLRETLRTILCTVGLVALLGLAGQWDRDGEKADECWDRKQVYDPAADHCAPRQVLTT